MKFTKDWALQMLDLNPDWMAIAVDRNGECNYFLEMPERNTISFGEKVIGYRYGCLGEFTYDGDWKDTLVVRKCTHILHPNINWKYCPKCGELLGSK